MIIMVSGLKRSGKDTVANYISQNYGYTRYAFADKIKEVCCELFDWTLEYIEQYKEDIDIRYGISPRQVLQWLGTEAMQFSLPEHYEMFKNLIGRNFWVKKFRYLYEKNTNIDYIISDYRFPHEYEELKQFNPITIQVLNNKCSCDGHESEKHISELNSSYYIDNNGTIEDLFVEIKNLMKTIDKK